MVVQPGLSVATSSTSLFILYSFGNTFDCVMVKSNGSFRKAKQTKKHTKTKQNTTKNVVHFKNKFHHATI